MQVSYHINSLQKKKISSIFWVILFTVLVLPFEAQKCFFLMISSWCTFSFLALAFGVETKKPLPNPSSWRFNPSFLKSFMVLVLTFGSLIHFVLVIVYEVRQGSNVPLLHVYVQLFQYHLLKKLLNSPLNCLGPFVGNQLTKNVRLYFWILNFIQLTLSGENRVNVSQ